MSGDWTRASSERSLIERLIEHPFGALLIAVLLYFAATAVGIVIGSLTMNIQPGVVASVVSQGAVVLPVLVTYKLAIANLGARPRDDLRAQGALPDLSRGIAAGALIFSAIVAVAALFGIYRVMGAGRASGLLPALVGVSLVPAFMEEILYRGILFRWIEEFAGSWTGLVVSSTLFGLAHAFNPGASMLATCFIAIEAGLLLGAAYMLTRSLWMPIGLHAAWNFTQGAVFGVPVSGQPSDGLIRANLSGPRLLSGGSFGLEASLFAVIIASAAGVVMLWLAIRRGQLRDPRWRRPNSD